VMAQPFPVGLVVVDDQETNTQARNPTAIKRMAV
jgi:hypothetical protein